MIMWFINYCLELIIYSNNELKKMTNNNHNDDEFFDADGNKWFCFYLKIQDFKRIRTKRILTKLKYPTLVFLS